jgi:glycerophosphoryl diester phosphodiesterase
MSPFYTRHRRGRALSFGHRGVPVREPENTLLGFRAALALGADGVELDLRLTADGAVVVLHDPLLDRTTDRRGAVSELTLSEVREARVLMPDGRPSGEVVPTLEDVLSTLPAGCLLNLELKATPTDGRRLASAVAGLLRGSPRRPDVILSSFDAFLLAAAHELLPDVAVALLLGGRLPDLGPVMRFTGAEAVHVEAEAVAAEDVAAWRAAGYGWAVYALWRPVDLRRLADADAFILDDPTWEVPSPAH